MYYYRCMGAVCIGVVVGMGFWQYTAKECIRTSFYREILVFLTRLQQCIQHRELLPMAIYQASISTSLQKIVSTQLSKKDLKELWYEIWFQYPIDREDLQEVQCLLDYEDIEEPLSECISRFQQRFQEQETLWRQQRSVNMKISTMLGILTIIVLL